MWFVCRVYKSLWIDAYHQHLLGAQQDQDRQRLQLQQRRQTQRNGSHSLHQKNDIVYYEWLHDVSSSVLPDGKFYESIVTYVMFRPSLGQYVYTIHSLDRKWKTSNIRESDNSLYFQAQLPVGAIIGKELIQQLCHSFKHH